MNKDNSGEVYFFQCTSGDKFDVREFQGFYQVVDYGDLDDFEIELPFQQDSKHVILIDAIPEEYRAAYYEDDVLEKYGADPVDYEGYIVTNLKYDGSMSMGESPYYDMRHMTGRWYGPLPEDAYYLHLDREEGFSEKEIMKNYPVAEVK